MGRGVSSADVQVVARHSFEDETMRTSDTVSCERAGSGHRSSTINYYHSKATLRETRLRLQTYLKFATQKKNGDTASRKSVKDVLRKFPSN